MNVSLPQGKTIVALSGGADSVALLRLLLGQGIPLVALHCNFGLRGEEAERDEAFVRDLCQRLGVELHVKHFATRDYARERGISVEMAARELRYEWFEQMRGSLGCESIAVAHHREDQAETVLLNLCRGTGPRGLAGMRERNGHIVRPLLRCSKQELLDYLASLGQSYVTDSTNLQREALRNRIRLDVVPLLRDVNPRAVEHIAETAELVRSLLDEREGGAVGGEGGSVREGGTHSLFSLHEWLRPYGFNSSQIRRIYEERGGQSGAVYESPTHRLLRDRGSLLLSPKGEGGYPRLTHSIHETDAPLTFLRPQPLTPSHAYLDADKLCLPLVERPWQRGDRFHPFGMRGTRLVSDFLTDRKLSLFEKERQRVLVSGGDIVWVVGLRSDDRYRVTADTRRIYCVSVE